MIADKIYNTYKAAIIDAYTPEQEISFEEHIALAHKAVSEAIDNEYNHYNINETTYANSIGLYHINNKIASLLLFINQIDIADTMGHDYQLLFDKDFNI